MSDEIDDADRARLRDLARTVFQALADEDWDAAAELVESEWSLISSFRISLVRTVADALPDEYVATRSRWAGIRRYLQFMAVADRARPTSYPDAAAHQPVSRTLLDNLTDFTSHSVAARTEGRFDDAARWAQDALDALRRAPEDRSVALSPMAATMTFQWGLSFGFAMDMTAAADVFELTYGYATSAGNPRVAAEAAGEAAWIAAFAGRGEAADDWIERAQVFRSAGAQKRLRPGLQLAIACRSYDRLDAAGATAALDSIKAESSREYRAIIAACRAMFSPLASGNDPREVLATLDSTLAALPSAVYATGANAQIVAFARSVVLAFAGQPERALPLLDSGVDKDPTRLLLVRRAAIHYMLGSYDAAERDADATLAIASGAPRHFVGAMVVKAAVALEGGNESEAGRLFEQAAHLALANVLPSSLGSPLPADRFDRLCRLIDAGGRDPLLARMAARPKLFAPTVMPTSPLSAQERRVIAELSVGGTVAQVASRLTLSPNTVKAHTRSIYRKLGVADRHAMTVEAHRRGLI